MAVFSAKLDTLPDTIARAASAGSSIEALGAVIRAGLDRPAHFVGSGGSQIVCAFAARCRNSLGGATNIVSSPLDFVLDDTPLVDSDVWLFSAGAANADIIAARQACAARGARGVHLLTISRGTALARTDLTSVHVGEVVDPKDGFLATHSLASLVTLWLGASDFAAMDAMSARRTIELFIARSTALLGAQVREALAREFATFGDFSTLIVLSDPRLRAAGVLLDTSLWEAGLCAVQHTDIRNFAHGRHVWLHKHGQKTALVLLSSADTSAMCANMLDGVPPGMPWLMRDHGVGGRHEQACAIIEAGTMVEAIGTAKGIDPGKPGVADFGRALYANDGLAVLARMRSGPVRAKRQAAARAGSDDQGVDYVAAEEAYLKRVSSTAFTGIVFDYDGTLVSTEGRFDHPAPAIVKELSRLLDEGVSLAIATGRGGSAGEDLREVLEPRHHDSVLMGYYNGGYLKPLAVDIREAPPPRAPEIEAVLRWIDERRDAFLKYAVKDSRVQLSLAVADILDADDFRAAVSSEFPDLYVTRSEHALDICLSSSCKTKVVAAIQASRPDGAILCIGDCGNVEGNDHKLLGAGIGVSVGAVCSRPDTGWQLLGPRIQGPSATVRILGALKRVGPGLVRLDVCRLQPWRSA